MRVDGPDVDLHQRCSSMDMAKAPFNKHAKAAASIQGYKTAQAAAKAAAAKEAGKAATPEPETPAAVVVSAAGAVSGAVEHDSTTALVQNGEASGLRSRRTVLPTGNSLAYEHA